MSYDWEEGDKASVSLSRKNCFEDQEDGTLHYGPDEGRMTNHYRHIVFSNPAEVRNCLELGPNITFIVERKSNSLSAGDPNGARPQGGFRHTYWFAKAGSIEAAPEGEDE